MHCQDHRVPFREGADRYGSVPGAVLESIPYEVGDDLRQPILVPFAQEIALARQHELAIGMKGRELVDHLPADILQVAWDSGDADALAQARTPEVEEIADH